MGEWAAPEPVGVLYIDAEMPPDLLRERMKGLSRRAADGRLHILNHAILFEQIDQPVNIAAPTWQEATTKLLLSRCAKVLVVDNLSTAAAGMKEDKADEWEKVGRWFLDLRRRGIAVVLVHHAGRNGQARGTSRREDATAWIINVTGSATESGARFTSTFTKASRNTAERIPALEWHYQTDEATGRVDVTCRRADQLATLRRLVGEGVTNNAELAEEMGVSPGTISKLAKKGIAAGWLEKQRRDYALKSSTGDDSGEADDGNERGAK